MGKNFICIAIFAGIVALGAAVLTTDFNDATQGRVAPDRVVQGNAAEATPADRDPERVLARVNDHEIKERDVDQIIMAAGPQFAMMYDNEQGRRAILDELIAGRLFAISGKEQGLDDTPEFRSALEGFTIQLLARAAVEAALENVTVSDEDSRRFYDENLDNFTIPEQIRASHILIPDDETTDDKIALIQEALENEVSFAALATEHSICPSAGRGGDLDFFGRGQMVSEFEEAAFALEEPGDISEPTRSDFGWHFIKLEERRPASAMPYEDVRPQIEQHLLSEMMTQRYEEALEALRQEHTVEILVD